MKKQLVLFVLLGILLLMHPGGAEAHFLATDRNIGAVLHVDPNDNPIAQEQASFFFDFKDKANKFKPSSCDCTFSINENGKEIYSQPLFQNNDKPSLDNASVFYTFPKQDVYTVIVAGKPIVPDGFQPFTLSWDFRIDQIAKNVQTNGSIGNFFSTHVVHFLGAGIGIVILVTMFISQILREKRR